MASTSIASIIAQLIPHHCFYAKLMVPKGFMSFRVTLNHGKLATEPKTIPLEAGIVLSARIAWGCQPSIVLQIVIIPNKGEMPAC